MTAYSRLVTYVLAGVTTLLLIEKNPFFAIDLVQIVKGSLPDVEITQYTDLTESELSRKNADPADFLVFRTPSSRDDALASLETARKLARSVIAISDTLAPSDWSEDGVIVLPHPFTEVRLQDALRRLVSAS
ncbi:hypothetical protein AB1M95_05780 [Sulfitobacter sp. LCG007]